MALLLPAALLLLVCVLMLGRRARPGAAPSSAPRLASVLPAAAPPRRLARVTVAELAFDYARAVLELEHLPVETSDRALRVLEQAITPLAGTFHLDEITPQLEASVRLFLDAEHVPDSHAASVVWEDMLRWGRWRYR